MERIENPEKYQSKVPFRKKVQQFLLKHILWIPVICLLLGLITALLVYRHHTRQNISLQVNYGKTIKRDDYKENTPKSKIEQFQEKITEKNQVKKNGRYERIVGGRDIVAANYGKITYADGEKIPGKPVEEKDTLQKQAVEPPVKTTAKVVHVPVLIADTVQRHHVQGTAAQQGQDTLAEVVQNPFATAHLAGYQEKDYIQSYVYGDQQIASGSFIKLRLGEPMQIKGKKIPVGTVFTGQVTMTANMIQITISRIERYNVSYQVYDADYFHGILIEHPKDDDMEQAINLSAYRSAGRTIEDMPYEVVQDVSRAILQRKRQKQRAIKLHDGYPVYIAEG